MQSLPAPDGWGWCPKPGPNFPTEVWILPRCREEGHTGHGRRARRTGKAVLVPAWTGFGGAAQVAQVRRTVTKKGKKTVEVVYLITSDRDADPGTLAAGLPL